MLDLNQIKTFVKPFYQNRSGRGWTYIESLLQQLDQQKGLSQDQYEILSIAILFHIVVFDPLSATNKENSASFLRDSFSQLRFWETEPDKQAEAVRLILMTYPSSSKKEPLNTILLEIIQSVFKKNMNDILHDEQNVFLAYQKLPLAQYRENRLQELRQVQNLMSEHPAHFGPSAVQNITALIELIKKRSYKIGLYPGSFNPFHIGHLNILQKAEKLFDKVIVARGNNPEKPHACYPMAKSLPNEIIEYASLVSELFQTSSLNENCELFLIRGLRNEFDLNTEKNMQRWIHDFTPDIRFVYFFCDTHFEHINSSQIRALAKFDPKLITPYLVP